MKYRVNKAWQRKTGVTCDSLDEAYKMAADHLRRNKDDLMEIWEIQGAVKRFFGVLSYQGIKSKDTWYHDLKKAQSVQ